MNDLATMIKGLSADTAAARVGDISTMADLLYRFDAAKKGAAEQGWPNLATVAEAAGEVVKKIIMEAVPDLAASFELVSRTVEMIADRTADGDLATFEGFPAELNLPDVPHEQAAGAGAEKPNALIDDAIVAEFLDQHSSSLGAMEQMILRLEKGPDEEALASVRRIFHTMKGEAGFLGLPDIEMVCHAAENFIDDIQFPYDVETVLAVKDWLAAALADMVAGRPISQTAATILPALSGQASGPPPAAPSDSTGQDGSPSTAQEPPQPAGQVPPAGGDPGPPAGQGTSAEPAAQPAPAAGADTTGADAGAGADTAAAAAAPQGSPPAAKTVAIPEEGFWPLTADASLLADFISEAREHLELANRELLNLETDPSNQEALNSVFRTFHTIKGISSFLDLEQIRSLAHDAENLLDLIRKGTIEISRGVVDVAFATMDMISSLIEKVKTALEGDGRLLAEEGLDALIETIRAAARGSVADPPRSPPSGGRLGEILIEAGNVTAGEIKEVLADERDNPTGRKLGELLVNAKDVAPREIADALRRQNAEKAAPAAGVEMRETIRVDYERLEGLVDGIGELVIAEAMITQDEIITRLKSEVIGKKLHNLKMISRQLQQLGTNIRMVPIAGTFQKMARLVRDLSKKTGKKINFHTDGDETELDRAYVDKIGDPLVHMIRNSVDHGVESPSERIAAGKPEQAQIGLLAYHEGGNIIVEVRDDGKGIDKDAVLKKALEKGLITPEEHLSDSEIYHLLFQPGFSTAAQVTDVSGRGVGMDVVKRNIEELRGQILVESEWGVGSTIKLILPLTMALIDGMVVRVGGDRFIFPVLGVVESLRASADMVHNVLGKGEIISLRDRQLPFFRLGELFEVPGAKYGYDESLVVVVENDGQQMGLQVDELVGLQQTVIKALGAGIGKAQGVAGGAIMANGTIGLILDIPGLFKAAHGLRRARAGNGIATGAGSVETPGPTAGNGDGDSDGNRPAQPATDEDNQTGGSVSMEKPISGEAPQSGQPTLAGGAQEQTGDAPGTTD